MKIGVLGLGNIAQKAYLPTYVKSQNLATFYFATRNEATREELKEKYQLQHVHSSLDELIAAGISACFIHSATKVHYQQIKQCLENDISVYVDKPCSENLTEVEALLNLAKEKGLLLMLGFNRRFAPMVEKLKALPDKRIIQLQKNRVAAVQPTDYLIYDLFLHLVDTAVYLLDEPITKVHHTLKEQAGNLEWAMLQLETANSLAILTMDLVSGANTESYQVTSPSGTYRVDDLVELHSDCGGKKETERFSDWQTTLEKRGFEQLVLAFINALSTGEARHLRQENILLSHQLCEKMIVRD
ncbi:MAG: Gfo/Idh/MocA family protein [Enterococcus sp.]